MFTYQVTLAATIIAAVSAAAVPSHLQARGTCKLVSSTSHSIGGGGPGQAPLNNYAAGLNCYNAAGDFVHMTDQDAGGFKAVTTVATAADCGLPNDVTVHTSYDSAGNKYFSCTYDNGADTGLQGEITTSIDSGTVSVSDTACTFYVNC